MNANELDRLLLLEQSGELSAKQRRRLDAELATSAEARQIRDQLRGLARALPPIAVQPASDAVAAIAARLRQTPRPAIAFQPMWKPALAAAAVLTLLLGIRTYQGRPPISSTPALAAAAAEEEEWADPFEAEFTELERLLTTISSDHSLEISEI